MSIPSRAFTPIRDPVYVHNDDDSFKTAQPHNVLEATPRAPRGVDERLTAIGSTPPVAGLPHYVPYAGQTPYNVWALYPQ